MGGEVQGSFDLPHGVKSLDFISHHPLREKAFGTFYLHRSGVFPPLIPAQPLDNLYLWHVEIHKLQRRAMEWTG